MQREGVKRILLCALPPPPSPWNNLVVSYIPNDDAPWYIHVHAHTIKQSIVGGDFNPTLIMHETENYIFAGIANPLMWNGSGVSSYVD